MSPEINCPFFVTMDAGAQAVNTWRFHPITFFFNGTGYSDLRAWIAAIDSQYSQVTINSLEIDAQVLVTNTASVDNLPLQAPLSVDLLSVIATDDANIEDISADSHHAEGGLINAIASDRLSFQFLNQLRMVSDVTWRVDSTHVWSRSRYYAHSSYKPGKGIKDFFQSTQEGTQAPTYVYVAIAHWCYIDGDLANYQCAGGLLTINYSEQTRTKLAGWV